MGIVFQSCFSFQLSIKLNEEDDHGILPLDLALKSKQEDLARNLVEHNVNIDQVDSNGSSLLHLAIDRGESNFRLILKITEKVSFNIVSKIQMQHFEQFSNHRVDRNW